MKGIQWGDLSSVMGGGAFGILISGDGECC